MKEYPAKPIQLNLFCATTNNLKRSKFISAYRVTLVCDRRLTFEQSRLLNSQQAQPILRKLIERHGQSDREQFCVLLLNSKNEIIGLNIVSTGTLSSAPVHPREVLKPAILANAGAMILCHNHPSGDVSPSPEDVAIGEAAGLKWKRVDFKNRTIEIHRNLVRTWGGKAIYKKPKTESSVREIKVPEFVIEALREQRKTTWKGDGNNFVFLNRTGRPLHWQTLNNAVIKRTLKKTGITTPISIKDTRASFITNALDENERMSFIQKQVGHTTTRMIVDHYYRHNPAPDDGSRLEKAWNSTRILPESDGPDLEVIEKIEK